MQTALALLVEALLMRVPEPCPPDAPMEGAGVSRHEAVVPTSAPAAYTAMKRPRPLTISKCGPMVCSAWLLICGMCQLRPRGASAGFDGLFCLHTPPSPASARPAAGSPAGG